MKRERSWGGLWWRERNAVEDRRSLAGLWSRRTVKQANVEYSETSLLFGLIRWHNGADDHMLRPAFPGPGWPALERAPARRTGTPSVFSNAQLEELP